MDKYQVKINPRAIRELNSIYEYIANKKSDIENGKKQLGRIKKAILKLATFPYSHQERTEGRYAKDDYRQLLIDNYIVIFRIDEVNKIVYVITVGALGMNMVPKAYFGVVERFSVFAATGFNAVLGIHLYLMDSKR